MINYRILDWDTNFFSFTVSEILPNRLDTKSLESILKALKKKNVSLVYWASDSSDDHCRYAAESLGGFPVCQKITYLIDLKSLPINQTLSYFKVEEYDKDKPNDELISLAIASGRYSRFNLDPKISKKQFNDLYVEWIINSTNKTIAEAVLVIREDNKIVGMITVGEKNGGGDIGLLAVDSTKRRMKIGTSLVRAANRWFISRGHEKGQVVTQGGNIAAHKLYEKCGYKRDKVENFYHFWL